MCRRSSCAVAGIDADDPANSLVEVKDRRSGERVDMAIADVVAHVAALT